MCFISLHIDFNGRFGVTAPSLSHSPHLLYFLFPINININQAWIPVLYHVIMLQCVLLYSIKCIICYLLGLWCPVSCQAPPDYLHVCSSRQLQQLKVLTSFLFTNSCITGVIARIHACVFCVYLGNLKMDPILTSLGLIISGQTGISCYGRGRV